MKRKVMIILSVALILCLTLAFASCGGGDTGSSSSVPQSTIDSGAGGESSNGGGTTDSSTPPTASSVPDGGEDKPCAHNFVSVEKKDATCIEDGYENYKCDTCGETKTETLPKTNVHNYVLSEEIAATCLSPKIVVKACSVCSDRVEETVGEVGEHSYAVSEEIAATCQHPKIVVKVCGVCEDRQEIEEGEKGPHTQEVVVAKEATCTEDGKRAARCAVCKNALFDPELDKVIPKLGHDFTEFVKNVKPTCVEEGYDIYKCVRCDETSTTKTADPTGNHGYARATVDGLIACYMCGKGYRDVTTEVTTEEDAFCMGCGKDPCECGSVGESNGYTPAKAPYELTAATEFTITEVALSDGNVALAIGNGMIVLTGTKETTYTVIIYSAIDGEAVKTFEVSGNYVLVDLAGYEQVCKVQITASTDATAQFYAPEN
ncbi:MAG: hypothetical protein J6B45_03165 [Clostridia bacterium]|nr:hypothetical protein [Clostridia bacterium]